MRTNSLLLLCLAGALSAQQVSPPGAWTAQWIDVPGTDPQGYGVYHFRRSFTVTGTPVHFLLRVSADNRYQLFVNGTRMARGPARGDLTHWRYDTVDIAPQLHNGENVLAAAVWNDGPFRAVAQISNQTAFVLKAEDPANSSVNTDRHWRCIADRAYSPQPLPHNQSTGYYALSANELFDSRLYPWNWQTNTFNDSDWKSAHEVSRAADRNARDAPNRWMLVPRPIPFEEEHLESPLQIRATDGIHATNVPGLVVPPNTNAMLLLDQGHLTTAYPELTMSGGAGARVSLRYAETLFDRASPTATPSKSNRSVVANKVFLGGGDTYLADGGDNRTYQPLYWRTYRYLRLEVQTAAEPLTVDGLRGTFTAYPFQEKAQLQVGGSSAKQVEDIITTGWRTARLCAHETYMDCPYYEQLQYVADARIQMMVSLYMTGDSRLMKNGIELIDSSRTAEGATYSRAPSSLQQYIPPFSLWWIGMLHDYWMYVDDPDFVRRMLPGVHAVLSFFARYQKPNGSLGKLPWWNFVDWVPAWPAGEPPADPDGTSATALDLQLVLAYQWATELDRSLGNEALAAEFEASGRQLAATVKATDWDATRKLFADQPSHRTYSQQVNTLAVLAGLVSGENAKAVVQQIFKDPSLAQSSIYFRAYTNAALREAGLGDEYFDVLEPWRHMLSEGLTTWAEWDAPDTRSDCHAWGASPNFELLRTVAGIESAGSGFKKIRIAPNLGSFPYVRAKMPHPNGEIKVDLQGNGSHLTGQVQLPAETTGAFEWHGRHQPLHAGNNSISF